MTRIRALLIAFAALLVIGPAVAQVMPPAGGRASERFLSFDSDITINDDTSLTVAETIRFVSRGINIRRGVIREFPTRYKNDRGDTVEIGFEVISVTRDGRDEPYQIDQVSNGVEVRIGSPNVMLTDGEHTYVITYRTTFQLGFFPEGDELYYNVTGYDWAFDIDKASATIRLPGGARPTKMLAGAGSEGHEATNATISEISPGVVRAESSIPLRAQQGLTIAVQWPKGVVSEPGLLAYLWLFLSGNLAALFGLGGLGAAFGALYYSWSKWGKDPERGTIIPLFEPPGGIEPAEARYLSQMGTDNKIFAAAIVNMAVKNAVKIDEDPGWFKKTFTLSRTGENADKLSPVERAAYDQLFASDDQIELKQDNWQTIQRAVKAVEGRLQMKHVGVSFHENTGALFAAVGILVVGGLLVFFTADGGFAPWIGGGALAIGLVLVGVFVQLMKAPTKQGQDLRDRIDGFKMFLDTAEKERWEILNPPDMTPELFEKYLPFALALDVDHTWSETFEREMRIREPGSDYHYQPRWYSGRNFTGIGAGALANSVATAMTSAISSSSSPPGKSSGFSGGGGGGFGGGGGGGGGGRGW